MKKIEELKAKVKRTIENEDVQYGLMICEYLAAGALGMWCIFQLKGAYTEAVFWKKIDTAVAASKFPSHEAEVRMVVDNVKTKVVCDLLGNQIGYLI